ncbi:hypothetical protein RCL1_005993 [Eukaryota sp. TZLM3-RCL]
MEHVKNIRASIASMIDSAGPQGLVNEHCRSVHDFVDSLHDFFDLGLRDRVGLQGKPNVYVFFSCLVSRNINPRAKEDFDAVSALSYVNTPRGQARAWIRMSLVNMSLEADLNALLSYSNTVASYFLPTAPVCQPELVSALLSLFPMLGSLTFDLGFDDSCLDLDRSYPMSIVESTLAKTITIDSPRRSRKTRQVKLDGNPKQGAPSLMDQMKRYQNSDPTIDFVEVEEITRNDHRVEVNSVVVETTLCSKEVPEDEYEQHQETVNTILHVDQVDLPSTDNNEGSVEIIDHVESSKNETAVETSTVSKNLDENLVTNVPRISQLFSQVSEHVILHTTSTDQVTQLSDTVIQSSEPLSEDLVSDSDHVNAVSIVPSDPVEFVSSPVLDLAGSCTDLAVNSDCEEVVEASDRSIKESEADVEDKVAELVEFESSKPSCIESQDCIAVDPVESETSQDAVSELVRDIPSTLSMDVSTEVFSTLDTIELSADVEKSEENNLEEEEKEGRSVEDYHPPSTSSPEPIFPSLALAHITSMFSDNISTVSIVSNSPRLYLADLDAEKTVVSADLVPSTPDIAPNSTVRSLPEVTSFPPAFVSPIRSPTPYLFDNNNLTVMDHHHPISTLNSRHVVATMSPICMTFESQSCKGQLLSPSISPSITLEETPNIDFKISESVDDSNIDILKLEELRLAFEKQQRDNEELRRQLAELKDQSSRMDSDSVSDCSRESFPYLSPIRNPRDPGFDYLFESPLVIRSPKFGEGPALFLGNSNVFKEKEAISAAKSILRLSLPVLRPPPIKNQSILCANQSCNQVLMINGPKIRTPRYCHYYEDWFCRSCHLNEEAVVPSWLIHRFDYKLRPVCNMALEFLLSVEDVPLIPVSMVIPLANQSLALTRLLNLKFQLSRIRPFVLTCNQSSGLIKLLGEQVALLEANNLSIRNIMEALDGSLVDFLIDVVDRLTQHITVDCELCSQKGFYCELCKSKEIAYSFMLSSVEQCTKCWSFYHRNCFAQLDGLACPKCIRIRGRLSRKKL